MEKKICPNCNDINTVLQSLNPDFSQNIHVIFGHHWERLWPHNIFSTPSGLIALEVPVGWQEFQAEISDQADSGSGCILLQVDAAGIGTLTLFRRFGNV